MPSFIDLHTHATPGHVTSFACKLQSKHFRSIAGMIARTSGEDLLVRARSIAIEVKHETLPANRTRLLAAPVKIYWQ